MCCTAGKVVVAWAVPEVQAPHDMAVVAAPMRLAGKERPIALLIGETRPTESRLQKYILLPEGGPFPSAAEVDFQCFSSVSAARDGNTPCRGANIISCRGVLAQARTCGRMRRGCNMRRRGSSGARCWGRQRSVSRRPPRRG